MKDNMNLQNEITTIVEQYILYNMVVEPVDGLFIAEDLSVSLMMEDDIFILGDFYYMKDLIKEDVKDGQKTIEPDYLTIQEIADNYNSNR